MTTYEEYQDMILEIDGRSVDKEARTRAREEAGITTRSFDYRGEDNEWNGTIFFEKDVPVRVAFYVWSATEEKMHESLSQDLGFAVRLVRWQGGNGHYTADIERVV